VSNVITVDKKNELKLWMAWECEMHPSRICAKRWDRRLSVLCIVEAQFMVRLLHCRLETGILTAPINSITLKPKGV